MLGYFAFKHSMLNRLMLRQSVLKRSVQQDTAMEEQLLASLNFEGVRIICVCCMCACQVTTF